MRKLFAMLFALTTLVGCATVHPTALEPEAASNSRTPSQQTNSIVETVTASLQNLLQIKPKRFEVYVYPKIGQTNIRAANFVDENVYLGKPRVFIISPIAVNFCSVFIETNYQADRNPKSYFAAKLAEDKKRTCSILEITDKAMSTKNRDLLRIDEVLKVRLYLDDQYRLHGYEKEVIGFKANTQTLSRDPRTDQIRNNPEQPSSSGLSFFPIDLPTIESLGADAQIANVDFQQATSGLDGLALNQVKRLNKNFQILNCKATQFDYKNYFGAKTSVTWCHGNPWPIKMENSRFLAITQPISLPPSR